MRSAARSGRARAGFCSASGHSYGIRVQSGAIHPKHSKGKCFGSELEGSPLAQKRAHTRRTVTAGERGRRAAWRTLVANTGIRLRSGTELRPGRAAIAALLKTLNKVPKRYRFGTCEAGILLTYRCLRAEPLESLKPKPRLASELNGRLVDPSHRLQLAMPFGITPDDGEDGVAAALCKPPTTAPLMVRSTTRWIAAFWDITSICPARLLPKFEYPSWPMSGLSRRVGDTKPLLRWPTYC